MASFSVVSGRTTVLRGQSKPPRRLGRLVRGYKTADYDVFGAPLTYSTGNELTSGNEAHEIRASADLRGRVSFPTLN
ncbi:hypothetical protein RB195_018993 [Necator americanus]|uniref:Uncharacterized protein n=1 Tax=Necator americanus TaxID=51031 RepID=A0ABR1CE60_NECAM